MWRSEFEISARKLFDEILKAKVALGAIAFESQLLQKF
jgi:hypothetical protein